MSSRPKPGTPRPYAFPTIHRAALENGLRVVTVPMPGRSLCAATLVTDAGVCHDSIEGTASLLARAFNEGTAQRDAAAFADACESLGMQVEAAASWDALSLGITAPRSRLADALALMAEAAWTPSVPADAFARIKAQRLQQIDQELANPQMRSALAFPRVVYTPDSTYARSARGTKQTVEELTRDHLLDHHGRLVSPGSATLVVAGDIEPAWVLERARETFGGFTRPEADRKAPTASDGVDRTTIAILDRPGSVQSNIAVGHIGLTRDHPDLDAFRIVNYALFGNFNSRLNAILREEKGFTYGVRGDHEPRRAAGRVMIMMPVQTPSTVEAVADTLRVVREIQTGGITDEELRASHDYLAGVYPLRFETPDQVASSVAGLAVYDLPDSDLTEYRERVLATTRAQASAAAAAHLHPDRLGVVIVGDASLIQAGLEELGPVTLLED